MAGMMDKFSRFCLQLAVTAAVKSDILDLKAIRDIGIGKPLLLIVQVDGEAMTDAGSDSTVQASLETDDLEAFGSATKRLDIGLPFGALSAIGTKRFVIIPPGAFIERWGRIDFTPTGGNLTTGKFTAWITDEFDFFVAAPKSFTGPLHA